MVCSWNVNVGPSAGACRWLGLAPNSDAENEALQAAVKKAGADSGLDPRFILAAVFQESAGCVRVKTTSSPNLGIRNPGLLQGPNGDHTCNDPEAGVGLLHPCPVEQINGEIIPLIAFYNHISQVPMADSQRNDHGWCRSHHQ